MSGASADVYYVRNARQASRADEFSPQVMT